MMRLARRTSLLVAFSLLASTARPAPSARRCCWNDVHRSYVRIRRQLTSASGRAIVTPIYLEASE
jgi:hypothetical protein